MNLPASIPQYILFSTSDRDQGTWRFSICSPTGTPILEICDQEPEAQGDRLDLVPVVLGLEALEQPSKITLCTPSRYVQEGIRFGLAEWQANGWRWEFFGEMVPVKNRDLWQRIERAMRFHQVECRVLRFDPPHRMPPGRNFSHQEGNPTAPKTPENRLSFSEGGRLRRWPSPTNTLTNPGQTPSPDAEQPTPEQEEEGAWGQGSPPAVQSPPSQTPISVPAVARGVCRAPQEEVQNGHSYSHLGGVSPHFGYLFGYLSVFDHPLSPPDRGIYAIWEALLCLVKGWLQRVRIWGKRPFGLVPNRLGELQ